MPLLKLETNVVMSDEMRNVLLNSLSKIVAQTIGKPEQYVMVTAGASAILMAGEPEKAAFMDVRSIGGLSDNMNRELSRKICALLKDSLGIPTDRIYLVFTDVQAGNWGWNGETFG